MRRSNTFLAKHHRVLWIHRMGHHTKWLGKKSIFLFCRETFLKYHQFVISPREFLFKEISIEKRLKASERHAIVVTR